MIAFYMTRHASDDPVKILDQEVITPYLLMGLVGAAAIVILVFEQRPQHYNERALHLRANSNLSMISS